MTRFLFMKTLVVSVCCLFLPATVPRANAQYSSSEKMNQSNSQVEKGGRISIPWLAESGRRHSNELNKAANESLNRARKESERLNNARDAQIEKNRAERKRRIERANKSFQEFLKDDLIPEQAPISGIDTPETSDAFSSPSSPHRSVNAPNVGDVAKTPPPKRGSPSAPKRGGASAPPQSSTSLIPSPLWGVESSASATEQAKIDENRRKCAARNVRMLGDAAVGVATRGIGFVPLIVDMLENVIDPIPGCNYNVENPRYPSTPPH